MGITVQYIIFKFITQWDMNGNYIVQQCWVTSHSQQMCDLIMADVFDMLETRCRHPGLSTGPDGGGMNNLPFGPFGIRDGNGFSMSLDR